MELVTKNFEIVGLAPILFGRAITSDKHAGEQHDAFERRVWQERCPLNGDGEIFVPGLAFKRSLEWIAKYLGESIKGKGKATYTKYFRSGIMVVDDLVIKVGGKPAKLADISMLREFVPSDGRSGSGSRVWKQFPMVQKWTTSVTINVIDKLLQDDMARVKRYAESAGVYNGLGMWRAGVGGVYGRYRVDGFDV